MVPALRQGKSEKSEPHSAKKGEEENTIPTISMDYMWMKSGEDEKDSEDIEIRGMPILVIKDSKTGFTSADVVTQKGAECGYAIKKGLSFLEYTVYKKVNLKSDHEEAIVRLKHAIKRAWQEN